MSLEMLIQKNADQEYNFFSDLKKLFILAGESYGHLNDIKLETRKLILETLNIEDVQPEEISTEISLSER